MPELAGAEGNSPIRFEGLSNLASVSMDSNQVMVWSPSTVETIPDDEWDALLEETMQEDKELLERLAED